MDAREQMIAEIESEARETAYLTGRPVFQPRVLEAIRRVRREAFVPEAGAAGAYVNRPYPIGHGQTISQPYIVALMTDLLDLNEHSKVLEVGTGSGYQAAVLAELAEHVWSVEVVEALSQRASRVLAAEGRTNVSLRVGDGSEGWREESPFDAIMVTAAASEVPTKLVAQLRAPGRMVVPVGQAWGTQELWVIEKDAAGGENRQRVLPVAFVPLVSSGGRWSGGRSLR
jgi:protein-L-isoaspartate(D-aspartate) O-methyltransferase